MTKSNDHPLLLAVESSCDDTSVAVMKAGELQSHLISSQLEHRAYGGVVPEMASRAHQRQIVWLVRQAMTEADCQARDLDALAVTRGPGLLGSLLVGISLIKGMALALDKPIIDIDHLEAHCLAPHLQADPPTFPYLCLLVSGGHTQLIEVRAPDHMVVLGRSIDDAAGEAFDKGAKMMGLPYPGGPQIQRWAEEGRPDAFAFSRARLQGLDFSFSGLKTSLLYSLRDHERQTPGFTQAHRADLCASYQQAILDSLLEKLDQAVAATGIRRVALAGGVAANQALRRQLQERAEVGQWSLYIPDAAFCTDNAAMIAMAAHFRWPQVAGHPLEMVPFSRAPAH